MTEYCHICNAEDPAGFYLGKRVCTNCWMRIKNKFPRGSKNPKPVEKDIFELIKEESRRPIGGRCYICNSDQPVAFWHQRRVCQECWDQKIHLRKKEELTKKKVHGNKGRTHSKEHERKRVNSLKGGRKRG